MKSEKYGERINGVAEALVKTLSRRGMRIATAESCTGGLLSGAITAVAGSSAVFDGGAVCYANHIKEALLGVNKETFALYGAVSARCAEEMAQGAAIRFSADIAIGTTGIAGPDGGSAEKPVGTVFICVARRNGPCCSYPASCGAEPEKEGKDGEKHLVNANFTTMIVESRFEGDREQIRQQAVLKALRLANAALQSEIYDDLALPLTMEQGGDLFEEGLPADPFLGEEL